MAAGHSNSWAGSAAWPHARNVVLVCAGYYAAGVVGLITRFPGSGISTLWLATAVLLAAFLVMRPGSWWALAIALLPVHLHLVWIFQGPVPVPVMLCQFAGNVALAVLTAALLRRIVDVPARFDDLESMAAFIVMGTASSWLVSAGVVYLFQRAGWVSDFWTAWRGRSMSNGLGTLLVTPLILWAATGGIRAALAAPTLRKAEFAAVIAGVIAIGIPVLHSHAPGPAYSPVLPLIVLPVLLWASVRFGPAGLSAAMLAVALLALSGAMAERGPFGSRSDVQNALHLQVFVFAAATPLLLLSALVQEHHRAMSSLRHNEARYRAVVEDQTELICRFLPDGTYTFVNGAYCRYFNRRPEELLGRTFWDFLPPADHAALQALLASITPHYPVATIEHMVVAPGGEIRWQHWTNRGFFDEHGRIVDYQAAGSDITERKRSEEQQRQLQAQELVAAALRQNEARLRQLADAMPQVVWAATPDGSSDYFNRNWYALAGAAEGLVGDPSWAAVLHPDDKEGFLRLWHHCVRSGQPFQAEVRLAPAGTAGHRWHLARALPVRDDAGAIVRWYGTCTDVHDHKLVEDALRESEAGLHHANRAKDRFLAVLSHELRTPLTPVLLAADAHRHDAALPDELCRDLNTIYTNAALEIALIDDLLDLTRVGRGKIELKPEPVDVHALLQRAARTCSDETFASKSLSTNLELTAHRHWVMADPTRLAQVFWNILKNAIKFSDPGGVLTVRTADADARALTVEFTDSGYGIEPNELSRIFDAFEQGGRDVTRKFGGMGLGLALCKAFVQMHDGRISAQSRGRGTGTTIRVDLPTIAPPQLTPAPADTPARPARTRQPDAPLRPGVRILLVEDHEFTADLLARLLRARGHDVYNARDLASARQAAQSRPVDLVISDLGLPDGTGLELMAELAREHGLRGIALSGYGMEDDRRQSQAAGFLEHLTKPVSIDMILEAIDRAVDPDHRPKASC